MKTIGIDCKDILSPSGEGAGIEHYVYNLASFLSSLEQADFRLKFFLQESLVNSEVAKNLESGASSEVVYFPRKSLGFWGLLELVNFLKKQNLDLLHGPANSTPLFYEGRSVITIHDLFIYENPQWFPGGFGQFVSKKVRVPGSVKKAGRIMAVSESTKKQIAKIFPGMEQKTDVTYEGVTINRDSRDDDNVFAKNDINQDYILYLGTIEPRKNIVRIVDSFEAIADDFPGTDLVLAGKKGWNYREIFEKIYNSKYKQRIKLTGYVSSQEKESLYKKASIFIFPSLAEGFGLPVLDAMEHSVPVVTSHSTALGEIARDAALLVDPMSARDISKGIKRVLSNKDFRENLVSLGSERVQEFSWQNTARLTLDSYKKALN